MNKAITTRARLRQFAPRFVDTAEETVHLLRSAPASVLMRHVIGVVPFAAGFMSFWSDMSANALAIEHCVPASFLLAMLFVWMKAWQTAFAHGLKCHLLAIPEAPWSFSRIARMAALQTAVQPTGLLVMPLAMVAMVPFHVAHAFYQNFTILADGTDTDIRLAARQSLSQARMWPAHNILLMWLFSPWLLGSAMLIGFTAIRIALSWYPPTAQYYFMIWFVLGIIMAFNALVVFAPFASAVAGNIALSLLATPAILHKAFGIRTPLLLAGLHGVFNVTFLMTVFWLSYLVLDPLMKAASVLRCHYGQSLKSGEDILAELRLLDRTAGSQEMPVRIRST